MQRKRRHSPSSSDKSIESSDDEVPNRAPYPSSPKLSPIDREKYTDEDADALRKMDAASRRTFTVAKQIIQRREIGLTDILRGEMSNEKRANLIEKYECLHQFNPCTEEYLQLRNTIRHLYHQYTNRKEKEIESSDPDINSWKQVLSTLHINPPNKQVLTLKLEEYAIMDSGDERCKMKQWLNMAMLLPFDRLSPIEDNVARALEASSRYLDATLFGMKTVKERLLLFLNKKLRNENTKGCNLALIGSPGVGKCLHPDTPVMMYDMTCRAARDIRVGDRLMGDDSTFRTVLSTITGEEEMFCVSQQYGEDYIVNRSHILTLLDIERDDIVDVPIVDVIGQEYRYQPISGWYNGSTRAGILPSQLGLFFTGQYNGDMSIIPHTLPHSAMNWTLSDKMTFWRSLQRTQDIHQRITLIPIAPAERILLLLRSAGIRCRLFDNTIIHSENEWLRISSKGIGQYCGFTISGNCRFLLGDWTATHNTAIAKALSACLRIPFEQVNFGGVCSADFLLGHDYTYIGSRPGEISRCLARMKTKNGILFFDEFDKASDRKEIMSTLLHLTDFSQNGEFRDNYFPELSQDLSKIWFMYSMNEVPTDPAMVDRLEMIQVDGYTRDEKKVIAKDYLFPKFMRELNLVEKFAISEQALVKLVEMDGKAVSGVRTLERLINLVMEKVYFYVCNENQDYSFPWFISMKAAMRGTTVTSINKLVMDEKLIQVLL